MESKRNGRLLTLSLAAFALAMGVLLALEPFQQVPVIPLRDGHVVIEDGAVVIEAASRQTDRNAAFW